MSRPADSLTLALAPVILALAALGCGQSAGTEDVTGTRSPILDGEPSPSQQDATVLVFHDASHPCTGVVVAPTLVLTSRSCLFELDGEVSGAYYQRCLPNGTGAPVTYAYNPIDFVISVGTRPNARNQEAKGVHIYAGADLDTCGNDLALLEVDAPLSPAPLAMRLDAGPRLNETGMLVGWGIGDDVPSTTQRQVRLQRNVQVLAIPGMVYQIPGGPQLQVDAGSFVTGEAGCFGDQGGAFLSDQTGAIVGLLSSIEPVDPDLSLDAGLPYCAGAANVYRSLPAQSQWIRDAFLRTQQVPWLEGRSPPAATGQSCLDGGDCRSGICKATSEGALFCSEDCSSQACPQGLQCVGAPGDQWCAPAQVPSDDAYSARCSVGFGGRTHPVWLALALVAIACLRKRRSKLATC